jgi:hypothetical protein
MRFMGKLLSYKSLTFQRLNGWVKALFQRWNPCASPCREPLAEPFVRAASLIHAHA